MNSKSGTMMLGVVAALALSGSTIATAADAAAGATAAPVAKPVPTSNKWRVTFDGKADADGEVVFNIIVDGKTTTITTAVKKGTGENKVAKLVVTALDIQAPPKQFHFETDDGESVLFKKKTGMGVPDFGVQLVNNSVPGISVKIKKD
jgi:hypothetical protein